MNGRNRRSDGTGLEFESARSDEQMPLTDGGSVTEEDDDETATGLPLTRRQILGGGAAAGLAAILGYTFWPAGDGGEAAAGTPTPTPTDPTGPQRHLPFDVWREMQAAIRESPDHLPARAERLVDAGDARGLFELVRDEIVTIPAAYRYAGRSETDVRWGSRGTLRGRMGTPREKADLLADLLTQVGFEAEIVTGDGLTREDLERLYFSPPPAEFAPPIDEAQVAAWRDELGMAAGDGAAYASVRLDPDGEDGAALAEGVLDALTDSDPYARASAFDWRTDDAPIVRFREAGEWSTTTAEDGDDATPTGSTTQPPAWRYANLFRADVPFGEHGESREPTRQTGDARYMQQVRVALEGVTADALDEPVELVAGEWSAADLVGRQLLVQTLPGTDPFDLPQTRFSDVQRFVPALTVQGGDLGTEEAADLSVVGDPFTRTGERLTVDDDGAISKEGAVTVEVDPDADPTDVTDLDVVVDAGRYPDLRLRVRATDADGNPVDGLPQSAFSVTDNGGDVVPELAANRAAPRILVLSDTSISMPRKYRGEGMDAFVAGLRETISAANPYATVQQKDTSSDIWTYLANAAGSDANLVVYATDGHVSDELTPERETAIREGPPAIVLSAHGDRLDVVEQMADPSGGTWVLADDQTATTEAIREYVSRVEGELESYLMDYGAPDGEGGTREAIVRVPEAGVEERVTYTVPDATLLPPHLAGLTLSVTVGRREVRRVLAGWDPATDGYRGIDPTGEQIAETTATLFGATTLSFEAGSVPYSVWLDDLFDAKCSVADLDAALAAGDREAIDAARAAGIKHLPPELPLLLAPLPDETTSDSLTYPSGLRVAMYRERPEFEKETAHHQADVFPFAKFRTVTPDDDVERMFRLTMERTARLAVVERDRYDVSTASLLADADLVPYRTTRDDWEYAVSEPFERIQDANGFGGRDFFLVPTDGTPLSFYHVDHETGALLGVLPDGSGGGSSHPGVERMLREFDRVISLLNLYAMAAQAAGAVTGPGGLALGIVAAYGQTLARLYAAAGIAILVMDTGDLQGQVDAALAMLACNVAKSLTLGVFKAGGIVAWLDNFLGAAGAPNPLSC